MAQRRTTELALENDSQLAYPPMKFLGLRVRYWARGVLPSAMFLSMWAYNRPDDFNVAKYFNSAPNMTSVSALSKMSKLKFNVDYSYGSNAKIDEMARRDELNENDATKAMAAAYGKDTLTTQEVYAYRSNLQEYAAPARNEAMEDLRDHLDFGKLVKGRHRITDWYGVRPIHPVTGEENVMHHGVDLKFVAGEPLMYTEDLTFLGEETKGTVKKTFFEDGKKRRIEIFHSIQDEDSTHTIGDVIPAGKMLVRTSEKDAKSTGEHVHIQAKRWKNGKLVEINPTSIARNIAKASPGFTEAHKAIPNFFKKRLKKADYSDFSDMPNTLDVMLANKTIKKKTAKKLRKIYEGYSDYVDQRAEEYILTSVLQDRAEVSMAFQEIKEDGAPDESRSDYADMVNKTSRTAQASLFNLSFRKKEKKWNDETAEAEEAEMKKAAPTEINGWGKIYERFNDREELRPWLTESSMYQVAENVTGVDKAAISQDILNIVADREDPELDPDVKNPDTTATARGFGQQNDDNIDGVKKRFPKLRKFPSVKERHLLKTERGISIQADYLLGNYASNYLLAQEEDEKYKAAHNGESLFNRFYVRSDNGKAVFMDYRRAATAGWGGIYGLVEDMETAVVNAKASKKPYPKYRVVHDPTGQNFTNYVDLSATSEYRAKEAQVDSAIAADAKLTKYYFVSNKRSVTKKKADTLQTAQANIADSLRVNMTTTDTLKRTPKYEFSQN